MEAILEKAKLDNPYQWKAIDKPLVFQTKLSEEAFDRFVLKRGDLRIERDKHGTVTIYPPPSFNISLVEAHVLGFLGMWSHSNSNLGDLLSINASFNLPDGSQHKADGCWVSRERASRLSKAERKKIPHVVPDFVVEVRSQSDEPDDLLKKMEEVWIANGVRLTWLIDSKSEKAWVFRADGSSEKIESFNAKLSGEDVLPGFELDLASLKK